ncbi:MAG: hypothetical protein ACJ762_18475 [Solirubrobacteraceae bacterium]
MTGVREIREAIDEMVAEGASLRQIERELIEDAPLSEDSRAALWLYAWGCLERHRPLVAA